MNKKYVFLFSLIPYSLIALPQGEEVKAGNAVFSKKEGCFLIEAADKTVINFESFNIGVGEKVEFIQPKSSSTILNKVQSSKPSEILGGLLSNGKVFLVNPNGIYFGPDAIVDTGSLIASTLDIKVQDFFEENYCFKMLPGTETAAIYNEGHLLSFGEGSIVLMAPQVINKGTILAQYGQIVLASAEQVVLDFVGDGLIQFAVDGLLKDGGMAGKVALDSKQAKKILHGIVNVEGIIEGTKLIEEEGIIRLVASSVIQGSDVKIAANNIQIEGQITSYWDVQIEAKDLLCVRDTQSTPTVLASNRHFVMESPFIDIMTLENPNTFFGCHGNMTFISNNPIAADGEFYAGCDFSLLKLDGTAADFISYFDPIITCSGNMTFGTYDGVSLKVEAQGSITCTGSSITITGPHTNACSLPECSSDPDCTTITTETALILISGTAPAVPNCNSINNSSIIAGGATFSNLGGSGSGIIFSQSNPLTLFNFNVGTFTGDLSANENVFFTGTGSMTFNGNVQANNQFVLTCNDTIQINGSVNALLFSAQCETLNVTGTVTGGTLSSPQNGIDVITTGDINIDGNISSNSGIVLQSMGIGDITLGSNVSTQNAGAISITTNGSVLLTSNSPINIVTNVAATIDITASSIDASNNQSLAISASGATVTIDSVIGAMSPPSFVSINSSSGLSIVQSITTGSGGITLGTVNAQGTFTTADGPVNLGALTLTENLTIKTNNGLINLNNTVDGAFSLTLTAGSGNINLAQAIGGMTPLTIFSIASSGTTTVHQNITTTSTLSMGGPVVLANDVVFQAGGPLSIGSTVDGAHNLTLTATGNTISVSGNIGDTTPITSLTVNNTSNFTAKNISTTGNLTVTNMINNATLNVLNIGGAIAVTTTNQLNLGGDINAVGTIVFNGGNNIALDNTITITGQNNITFNTPLNAKNPNNQGLTVFTPGVISFKNIGSTNTLAFLTVNSGAMQVDVNGNITTSGPIVFNSNVVLGANSIWTTNNADISIDEVNGNFAWTMSAGTGVISFNADLGSITPLTSITVQSSGSIGPTPPVAEIAAGTVSLTSTGSISIDAITTSSAMGGIVINQTMLAGSSSLNLYDTLTSADGINITSASPIVIFNSGNLASMGNITITALSLDSSNTSPGNSLTMTAGGADINVSTIIGAINPINQFNVSMVDSLTLSAVTAAQMTISANNTTLNGNLTTLIGPINIASPITLGNSVTITAGNTSSITIVGAITGTVSGNGITLGGLGPISLNGNITTNDGAITINGHLSLLSDMVFSSSGGNVSLNKVNGAFGLTINAGAGSVTFNDAIGNMTPLTSLIVMNSGSIGPNPATGTITAGTVSLTTSGTMTTPAITTTSAMNPLTLTQTMSGVGISFNLDGSLNSADGITIMSAVPITVLTSVTLTSQTSNLTINAPSIDNVSFSSNADLTLSALSGNIDFIGISGIGLNIPLSSFVITSANQVILTPVSTKAGGVDITASMLTLSGNITTQNGPITLNEGFDITTSVTLNSGVATTLLGGNVTSSIAGNSFTAAGTGPVILQGNITTNNGAIAINGALKLQVSNPTLSSTGGNITLSLVDGNQNFTVDAGAGTVILKGAIGQMMPLASFTATGTTIELGNNITTGGGPIIFNGNVIRNNINEVTLNTLPGGIIAFNGTINADIINLRSLTLLSGTGTITFGDSIGNGTGLNDLTVTGGVVNFQGNLYNAVAQSYTGTDFNFSTSALLIAHGGISFSFGPINLLGGTQFIANTNGGDFSFEVLNGMGQNVGIFAGAGTAFLGEVASLNDMTVFAGNILLNGPITSSQVEFTSNTSIINGGMPQPITLTTTSVFETNGGTIGTLLSPIAINNPTGIVIAGTPSMLADFSGITVDNTIHVDPNNPACPVIFNGIVIHPCPLPPPPPHPPGPPPPPPPPIVVPPLPAREFFVPGIYSQYNSLASDLYFLPEIIDSLYILPREVPLFSTKLQFGLQQPERREINLIPIRPQYRSM